MESAGLARRYFALSKREMQVVAIVYQRGEASAREIQARLPVCLANSTVRTVLTSLERKGALSGKFVGKTRIYSSSFNKQIVSDIVLRNLVDTYHSGSYAETLKQVILMYHWSVTECDDISARLTFGVDRRLKD